MARPRIEIGAEEFEQLCGLQCSLAEMAFFFRCSEDTVERWCRREFHKSFAEVFAEKRCGGFISLRRNQFKLSERYPAMAIWLGKQYLGQVERPEENIDTEDSGAFFDEAGLLPSDGKKAGRGGSGASVSDNNDGGDAG